MLGSTIIEIAVMLVLGLLEQTIVNNNSRSKVENLYWSKDVYKYKRSDNRLLLSGSCDIKKRERV